jgi:glycosyltransferase involved in cell wall biosynthesis
MRILVLTPYLYGTAPGPRSSIELWERILQPAGITFEYVPFESERLHQIIYAHGREREKAREMLAGLRRRVLLMSRLGEFDAVLVYREAALLGPALLERWIRRSGKPIIYQLDDPLYIPYRSPWNGYLSYLKFFGKVKSLIRMSRVVIVNSPQHRQFAEPLNRNVWEIPSCVDDAEYKPLPTPPGNDRPVCVGWSGSASTSANLSTIAGVLRELGARPDVELRFIGATTGLPNVRYTLRPWRPETEVSDLRRFDVGLLPLQTNEWNRRKFYLKLVQYMALGIPAVAAPLGANPYVIEHGRTGFLASSEAQWRETLVRLIADPELRVSVGRAAGEVAHARYTLAANAEKIVAAFRSVRELEVR